MAKKETKAPETMPETTNEVEAPETMPETTNEVEAAETMPETTNEVEAAETANRVALRDDALRGKLQAAIVGLTTDSGESLLLVAEMFASSGNRALMREVFASLTVSKKVAKKSDFNVLKAMIDCPEGTANLIAVLPTKGILKVFKAVNTLHSVTDSPEGLAAIARLVADK